MKKFCLIALFITTNSLNLNAQTNTTAAPQTPHGPTQIDSDKADFDLTAHKAIYRGNVRVSDPQMKLRCEWLVADLPQPGGRMEHIVAETNVVIDSTDAKGQPMHTTSEKAVYVYQVKNGATNEIVTLTGNPQIVNAQGTQAGDVIIWHRAADQVQFINPHMILKQIPDGAHGGTNSRTANTNKPAAPK